MTEDIRGRARVYARLLRRLALLAVVASSTQACSFIFVKGPPAEYAGQGEISCTSSRLAPAVDVAVTAFQVVRTGYALSSDDSTYDDFPISRGADIGFGVALTSLFAVSTVYGFVQTASCARAQAGADEAPIPEGDSWKAPAPALQTLGATEPPRSVRPPAPAAPPPVPKDPTCTHDAQCPGAEICETGRCVVFRPPPGNRPPSPDPGAAEPEPPDDEPDPGAAVPEPADDDEPEPGKTGADE